MQRSIIPVVAVLALAIPAAAYTAGGGRDATAEAVDANRCQLVTGGGRTEVDPATGVFVGRLRVRLDGVLRRVPVTTRVVRQSQRDGVLYAVTSHTLAFRRGDVTTIDQARAIPTGRAGVYRLLTLAHIRAGGRGFLVLHGTVEFNGIPSARARIVGGQLCR